MCIPSGGAWDSSASQSMAYYSSCTIRIRIRMCVCLATIQAVQTVTAALYALQNQLCCLPNFVCGEANAKSCCGTNQECCGNRDCCNTASTAIPKQNCASNKVTGPPQNDKRCCLVNQVNCNGTCCTTQDSPPTQECLVDANGLALCCNRAALCASASDGVQSCCTGTTTCVRNLTSAGLPIARCCPAGFSLCPKNNFQPICCQNGRCPSPSSSDNCLTT